MSPENLGTFSFSDGPLPGLFSESGTDLIGVGGDGVVGEGGQGEVVLALVEDLSAP